MSIPPLRGRFVWHELLTTSPAAALQFYTRMVGWKSEPWDQVPDYTLLLGRRGPVAGVTTLPAEARAMGAPPSWLSYMGTADVDATVQQALGLGARVLTSPTDIPVGRFAVLADPQGAVFALYSPNLLAESDPMPQVGEFSWHELATTDLDAAWSFYQQLFGWQKSTAVQAPGVGTYQLYGFPGLDLGGIYKIPPGMQMPPNWVPYMMVADSRKAAAYIGPNGGTLLMGPMEVPGGDLIAMGHDPQGAMFAVHSRAGATRPAVKKPAAKKPAAKKKAAKKPVKKAAKKPAKKAARKPVKKAAKKVVKKAARKPAKQAARRPRHK